MALTAVCVVSCRSSNEAPVVKAKVEVSEPVVALELDTPPEPVVAAAEESADMDKGDGDKSVGENRDTPADDIQTLVPASVHANTLRMAVVVENELLTSERLELTAVKEKLAKQLSLTVNDDPADDEERAASEQIFALHSAKTLPTAWRSFETVVVIAVNPYSGTKPKRESNGIAGVAILRPPETTPVFLESGTGQVLPIVYLLGNELNNGLVDMVALAGDGA